MIQFEYPAYVRLFYMLLCYKYYIHFTYITYEKKVTLVNHYNCITIDKMQMDSMRNC